MPWAECWWRSSAQQQTLLRKGFGMHRIFDWLILVLYVAIVFLFVRPGSKGPQLVETTGKTLVNLVTAATGGGGWSGNK